MLFFFDSVRSHSLCAFLCPASREGGYNIEEARPVIGPVEAILISDGWFQGGLGNRGPGKALVIEAVTGCIFRASSVRAAAFWLCKEHHAMV